MSLESIDDTELLLTWAKNLPGHHTVRDIHHVFEPSYRLAFRLARRGLLHISYNLRIYPTHKGNEELRRLFYQRKRDKRQLHHSTFDA